MTKSVRKLSKSFQMPTMYANSSVGYTNTTRSMKVHYEDRDSIALGQLYVDHVMAMTAEGLHDKSAIAGELAWRDLQIKMLKEAKEFAYNHLKDLHNKIGELL